MKRREWLKALIAIPAAAVALKTAKPKIKCEWFWTDNADAYETVQLLKDYEITPGSITFAGIRTTGRLSTGYIALVR